jgi:hypothetical protein
MLKTSMLATLVLGGALLLMVPAQAKAAQVSFGVAVGVPAPYVVAPPVYGYAAVSRPYVVAPAPYVAVAPGYAYPGYFAPGRVFVGGRWVPKAHGYRYAGRREYWRR